jgi:hypothetical protein
MNCRAPEKARRLVFSRRQPELESIPAVAEAVLDADIVATDLNPAVLEFAEWHSCPRDELNGGTAAEPYGAPSARQNRLN